MRDQCVVGEGGWRRGVEVAVCCGCGCGEPGEYWPRDVGEEGWIVKQSKTDRKSCKAIY